MYTCGMKTKKRKKTILIIILSVIAALVVIDIIGANILINALLVPSFMKKLDDYERVTQQSLDEQVHTDDIMSNRELLAQEAKEFVETHEKYFLTATSTDGYELVAEEFLQDDDSHLYVLLIHGYMAKKEDMEVFAPAYYEKGYNILIPDLRCQGESDGDFIGMGYTDSKDCLLWLDEILTRDPDAEIAIHGQSMGAATTLQLSVKKELPENVFACVSDCSFISAKHMAAEKIWAWFHIPPHPLLETAELFLLLRGGYPLSDAAPLKYMPEAFLPTLFIHGTDDKFVSVDQGYSLYEASTAPDKELMIVEGAGHAQSLEKDPAAYFEKVFSYLDRHRTR